MTRTATTSERKSETAVPYLLVLIGDASRMIELPHPGSLAIGRSQTADVRIDDPLVSRQHARIDIVADGETAIVDLDSKTGTQVNGESLRGKRVLLTGDMISIGAATLVFHGGTRVQAAVHLLELPRFRDRLQEELDRAQSFARSFALVCVELGPMVERRRVLVAIGPLLRRIDAIAWAGDGELFAVLPERGPVDAAEVGAALVGALVPLATEARAGIAVHPIDGANIEGLLAGARRSAIGTPPGTVAAAAREPQRLTIGGRPVIVADAVMTRVYSLIERLAPVALPVLVTGDTGTGKELAALALHERSPRQGRRFAAVNCAALPEALLESELFGHERGAFSGAVAAKPGILEDASGGTVFLDEIGEMPLPAQAKLLRVLETGLVTRLGDLRERAIDIRLVAATHRNLEQEVRAGRFREDLFFRINGAQIQLPALRERPAEIPLLAQLFLDEACDTAGQPRLALSSAAREALVAYPWPGNVRELRNLVRYVAATCKDPVIEPWHFEDRLGASDSAAPAESSGERQFRPLAEEVRELERRRIIEALETTGGNQTKAAALLKIPLRTFYDKVKALGLSRRSPG